MSSRCWSPLPPAATGRTVSERSRLAPSTCVLDCTDSAERTRQDPLRSPSQAVSEPFPGDPGAPDAKRDDDGAKTNLIAVGEATRHRHAVPATYVRSCFPGPRASLRPAGRRCARDGGRRRARRSTLRRPLRGRRGCLPSASGTPSGFQRSQYFITASPVPMKRPFHPHRR